MPPHHQLVDLVGQRLQDGQLGRDLGAADDGDQRTLGLMQGAAQRVQLGFQQRTGAGHRREAGDAVRGGLGAVRRAEGVVDVDVAQRGHLPGQRLVVLLLADVDAAVFQQHDLAGVDLDAVNPVLHQRHGHAQQLGQALADLGQRIGLGQHALFRAAQVGRDHHGRAGVQRQANAGHGGADAGVFGNAAGVVERHVQVGADEHALAGQGAGLGQRGQGLYLGHMLCFLELANKGTNPLSAVAENPFVPFDPTAMLTWPTSARRWCRACGSRSPTRCRTRTRP